MLEAIQALFPQVCAEQERHAAALREIDAQARAIQQACPHATPTFHPDPCGGYDSFYRCPDCGAEKDGKTWRFTRPWNPFSTTGEGGADAPPPEEQLDPRCPEPIRRLLRRIAEQCGKEQYWNALAYAVDLHRLLMEKFDEILKRPRYRP